MGLTMPKKTAYPAFRARKIEFGLAGLYAGFSLRHLREKDGALVCAEGTERRFVAPSAAAAVYTVGNEVYTWSAQTAKLYRLGAAAAEYSVAEKPNRLISFPDRANNRLLCAVGGSALTIFGADGSRKTVAGKGGACAAVFKERLFTADGNRIRYSEPLQPDCWEEARGKGGYIELPSEDGEFLGAVALRDQLFFFRERGIVLLRANGDELNFRAVPLRFGAGAIVSGSIADCGNAVYFFTDRGLFSFSGGACVKIENSLFSRISGKPSQACSCNGNYYALCTNRQFGKCVYCYEPLTGRARFILSGGSCLAGGESVFTASGTAVSRLSEIGMPQSGACELSCGLSELGMSGDERFLDGIKLSGEGTFTVTVRTERGDQAVASGEAETVLRFPVRLRGGKFSISVRANGTAFKIRSLTVLAREI